MILLALIVILLMGYVTKRYHTLRIAAHVHGMGQPISTRDWKAIVRDRQLYDVYLSGVRRLRMIQSINTELNGKTKVWVRRDEFGVIKEIRQ